MSLFAVSIFVYESDTSRISEVKIGIFGDMLRKCETAAEKMFFCDEQFVNKYLCYVFVRFCSTNVQMQVF